MPEIMAGPTEVFHVGRPDVEEPHKNMERCDKFHANNPNHKLVLFVWEEKDRDELLPKINKEKCDVYLWQDDARLMDWLMDRIANIVGTRVVWPQWFVCPEQHITSFNYKQPVQKCETCGQGVALVNPLKERLEHFCEVFNRVLCLATFDTTSGQYLHSQVDPTSNVLFNMPWALGCPHKRAIQCSDLKASAKGKPALLCGAGPSLEDALPHIQRLQEKCVILCVGRAFKLLRQHEIRVDYTLSCEMFEWDAAIFQGLTEKEVGKTILAFASVCAPATVTAWPGDKVCLWDISSAKLLKREDWIYGGNSVSHQMLNFAAQILEADPLVLVGNDLAYTKPKTHAEGTLPEAWPQQVKDQDVAYQNEAWVPCTGKGDNFHPECHRVVTVLGHGGAKAGPIEVRSSPAYRNFCTLFEILISRHAPKTVYNACPNGQKIEKAPYLDLGSWNP